MERVVEVTLLSSIHPSSVLDISLAFTEIFAPVPLILRAAPVEVDRIARLFTLILETLLSCTFSTIGFALHVHELYDA